MATRTRSELAVIAWSAATFGALLASYSAFRPVRDALVLDGDPEKLPWVFIATAVAISIASPVWSALLARRAARSFVATAFHAFAACAAVFFVIVETGVAPIIVGRVFYVWSAVFNLFVVSVFWSLLADLLGPTVARRLYGPIAAGGTIGTLVGPVLTGQLVGIIGVGGVLAMSALLLELAVLGVGEVRRAAALLPRADELAPDVPPGGGPFTGLARVVRTPYLLAIVGYVLCTATAATFLYLTQAQIVSHALPDRIAKTEFFAAIDFRVAVLTLVFQLVISRFALAWLNPGIVLCVLPLVQLFGISELTAAPTLAMLMAVQVISRSATHGLTRPARELLFTVVTRDDKYRAKNAIDTIGYRLGDLASSWVYTGLRAISTGAGVLVGATVGLVAIWLAIAAALGLGFRRRVAASTTEPRKERS
jgi:AAA family ATP:ADP antiporter